MPEDVQERNWATLCHIGGFGGYIIPLGNIIAPLVLWLMKKDENPFVDYHGKEAVNFNISWTIYFFFAALLVLIVVGFVLLVVLVGLHIVFIIRAAMRTSRGDYHRYPLTIRFIN